jgi:hypothetical protein
MSESPEDYYDLESDDDVCQRCSGEGYYHDCGEDTCCCGDDPDDADIVTCPDCGGTGCWSSIGGVTSDDTGESTVNKATELAIELWGLRVNRIFNDCAADIRALRPVNGLTLIPPQIDEINAIQAALTAAEDDGIHKGLLPVIRAIDAIDNGEKMKARAALQAISDELRGLKSSSVALAK